MGLESGQMLGLSSTTPVRVVISTVRSNYPSKGETVLRSESISRDAIPSFFADFVPYPHSSKGVPIGAPPTSPFHPAHPHYISCTHRFLPERMKYLCSGSCRIVVSPILLSHPHPLTETTLFGKPG